MTLELIDFEHEIASLMAERQDCIEKTDGTDPQKARTIGELSTKIDNAKKKLHKALSPWQIVKLARHPSRPHSLDIINRITTDFQQLHGDRHHGDCPALVAGLAYIDHNPVVIICQEKGRDTSDRIYRNFGMPQPEGYRKALRIMKLAEKFNLPVISIIDTPGAYPGVDAERFNQSEAIARNIFEMAQLKVPIISLVLGEGMSGGALAIGVANYSIMMEYAIYSVISPEGCAAILWKNNEKASQAAEILQLTAPHLLNHKFIDEIIKEPLGGAHFDYDATANAIKESLLSNLKSLSSLSKDELVRRRQEKLRRMTR